jgi:ABC-type spermidine/putrescine transport system permease subunit II
VGRAGSIVVGFLVTAMSYVIGSAAAAIVRRFSETGEKRARLI